MPGISNKDWILGHMEALPFVQWDRFTHDTWFDEAETVSVYGWIYREDDYKDFVLIRFWPQMEEFVFTTSSEKYSTIIQERLLGHSDDHNHCKRVENHFDLENMVETQ